jgi:tetratricopeptide (TPR) repeat protein
MSSLQESLRTLKTAEAIEPMNPFLYREMAESYFAMGQPRSALDNIAYAISLEPTCAYYQYLKARIHVALEAPADAVAAISRAIDILPASDNIAAKLEYHKFRALLHDGLGNHQLSFDDNSICSTLDSHNAEYSYKCAMYFFMNDDWPHAYDRFEDALRIDPNHEESLLQFAKLKRFVCDYHGAIDCLHGCKNRKSPEFEIEYGNSLYGAGMLREALTILEKVESEIEVVADCFFHLERHEECIEVYKKVQASSRTRYMIGEALHVLEKWEDAVAELNGCDGPFFLPAHSLCAKILYTHEKFKDSIIHLNEYDKLLALDESQHNMRGRAYYKLNDYNSALRDWEILLTRDNTTSSMMADSYLKIEQYRAAETILDSLVVLDGADEELGLLRMLNFFNRAKIYTGSFRDREAIDDLNRGIELINNQTQRDMIHDMFEMRGRVFRRLSDLKRASVDLETAAELIA